MPIIDLDKVDPVDKPELVIGLVAAVGTPLDHITRTVKGQLEKREYSVRLLRLSDSLAGLNLEAPSPPPHATEFERVTALMDQGDELRSLAGGGEALALMAAARINAIRFEPSVDDQLPHLAGTAFILRQLKHPHEVYWLRKIYGAAFHLVGVFCPQEVRVQNLKLHSGMSQTEAELLIERDEREEQRYGQQLRDTFHLSDVFVELSGSQEAHVQTTAKQVGRYFKLLFAELDEGVITPTRDEYGMYLAYAASLRSADLSRQVGAAILTSDSEVLAVGANDVPSPGGGQYWGGPGSARDTELGYDSNARIKRRTLEEIVSVLQPEFKKVSAEEQRERLDGLMAALESTRIMNLTEFGRATHAEMEAILSAARVGASTKGNELFTTTFPCHNCAKHIIGAGIKRVVYIEPYPASLSRELHEDGISFEGLGGDKVSFQPFVGVAPRIYETLFSILTFEGQRLRRKDDAGLLSKGSLGLRVRAPAVTYVEYESAAAVAASTLGRVTNRERDDE